MADVKTVRLDFWRVQMPDEEARSFGDVLDIIAGLPDDDARNVDVRGPIRMRRAGAWNQSFEGDMIRIRMDVRPIKASLGGQVERIRLRPDEGLGEETAFLFHRPTSVLVMQRNRFSVSASNLAQYVQTLGGVNGVISLEPLLQEAAVERLAAMTNVRRFVVKFAKMNNLDAFAERGVGVGKFVELVDYFKAPEAQIAVSMGHGRGGLKNSAVVTAAKALLKVRHDREDQVKSIVISGESADDEREVLDLVEWRLQETLEVELDANRGISYLRRRGMLREAWGRRAAEVRRILREGARES